MSEVNKSIFRRFVDEVVNRGDLGAVNELLAENYVDHHTLVPGLPIGREGVKQQYALLHAAFPDISVSLEQTIAEGDRVACHSIWRATHRNALLGEAPTGKTLEFEQHEIVRVSRGRIVEHWSSMDHQDLAKMLI